MLGAVGRHIGILGLGRMGAPIARRLRRHGFDVTVSDIDETTLERARGDDRAHHAPHGEALASFGDVEGELLAAVLVEE